MPQKWPVFDDFTAQLGLILIAGGITLWLIGPIGHELRLIPPSDQGIPLSLVCMCIGCGALLICLSLAIRYWKKIFAILFWVITVIVLVYGWSHLLLTEFAAPKWITPGRSLLALLWCVVFAARFIITPPADSDHPIGP